MFNKQDRADSKIDKKETSQEHKRYGKDLGQNPSAQSIFSKTKPIKIKVSPGMLNRINNSKKFTGVGGIQSSLAAGLHAARTASRGAGVASGIGQNGVPVSDDNYKFYGMNNDKAEQQTSPKMYHARPSVGGQQNETSQERQKYKKLTVNQDVQRPPVAQLDEKAEKEKQNNEYKSKIQSFSANNYLQNNSSKVPLKAFAKMGNQQAHMNISQTDYHIQHERPTTPEEQKKKCLNCDNMGDFIKGLQGEIKRLQDLTNDLQMQLVLNGVSPQVTNIEKKPFNNICPQCTHTKALQRPASSSGRGTNSFKIKKGQSPAALTAINQRKQFEQEQQSFIHDMKSQINYRAKPSKLSQLKKKTNEVLSPLNITNQKS